MSLSVTNFNIDNASGQTVRLDIEACLKALQGQSAESSDLNQTQCVAGMTFLNTTTDILKIRNSNNNGFTDIGNIDQPNLGLLSKSGGTMTGALLGHDGSNAAAPAFSFDTDTDLGLFRNAANIMGFASGGTEQMIFSADGITLRSQNEIRFGDNDNSHYVAMKAGTTTANRTLTLPNESGTVLTSATSIPNSNLANSSITIGSTSIALGASNTTISGIATLTATNLRATNFQDNSGNTLFTDTQIAQGRAKAWVRFNGTGTPAITDSFNIDDITDEGNGIYDVEFTSNMTNANYAVVISARAETSSYGQSAVCQLHQNSTPSVSEFRICRSYQDDNNNAVYYQDSTMMMVAVFGD